MIIFAGIVFILGYLLITLEGLIKMNKTATALITGIVLWIIYFNQSSKIIDHSDVLALELGKISEILFFLLGAMTIVEIIDSQKGFYAITKFLNLKSISKLWWSIGIVTFFLSALIDNLTTTIVMITIISKLIHDRKNLLLFSSMIIIASNAGGSWSPIGDFTTTMLWIGEQISSWPLILNLFVPSLVSCLVSQIILEKGLNKKEKFQIASEVRSDTGIKMLILGAIIILFVPLAKSFFHIPPFLSMLLGLAIIWIYAEFKNRKKDSQVDIANALQKIDTPTILFFLGILLSISALEKMEILSSAATLLTANIKNIYILQTLVGLLSAVVDNVPLVAAMQSMFSLDSYPQNHAFWQLLAYCAGTGGSILIIGSAAGVVAMSLQKIDFIWYLKKVSFAAIIGYLSGLIIFFILHTI
jgi:Na+/H+ antiporter NhaD/arsenite permease-like protein